MFKRHTVIRKVYEMQGGDTPLPIYIYLSLSLSLSRCLSLSLSPVVGITIPAKPLNQILGEGMREPRCAM